MANPLLAPGQLPRLLPEVSAGDMAQSRDGPLVDQEVLWSMATDRERWGLVYHGGPGWCHLSEEGRLKETAGSEQERGRPAQGAPQWLRKVPPSQVLPSPHTHTLPLPHHLQECPFPNLPFRPSPSTPIGSIFPVHQDHCGEGGGMDPLPHPSAPAQGRGLQSRPPRSNSTAHLSPQAPPPH